MSARMDLIFRLADEVTIACDLSGPKPRGSRGTIAGACGDAYDAGERAGAGKLDEARRLIGIIAVSANKRIPVDMKRDAERWLERFPKPMDEEAQGGTRAQPTTPLRESAPSAAPGPAQNSARAASGASRHLCRACSECEGNHHWIESAAFSCKHCDAMVPQCEGCDLPATVRSDDDIDLCAECAAESLGSAL